MARSLNFTLALILVAGALPLSACAYFRSDLLTRAQDDFDKAASAQRSLRLDGTRSYQEATADVISAASARSYYASALQRLREIGRLERGYLADNDLAATAKRLEALCLWKLGRFEEALAELESDDLLHLPPRDRAIARALPGIIRLDRVYQGLVALEAGSSEESFSDAPSLEMDIRAALGSFASARLMIGAGDEIQTFLIQAQLTAYDRLRAALENRDTSLADEDRGEVEALLDELTYRLPPGSVELSAMINAWEAALQKEGAVQAKWK